MQQRRRIQPKGRTRRSLCLSLFIRLPTRYTGARRGRSRKNEPGMKKERERERERVRGGETSEPRYVPGCRHCPAKLRIATLTIRRLFQGLPAPERSRASSTFRPRARARARVCILIYIYIYISSAFQPPSRKLLNSLLMTPMACARARACRSAPCNNVVIGRENIIPGWLCVRSAHTHTHTHARSSSGKERKGKENARRSSGAS